MNNCSLAVCIQTTLWCRSVHIVIRLHFARTCNAPLRICLSGIVASTSHNSARCHLVPSWPAPPSCSGTSATSRAAPDPLAPGSAGRKTVSTVQRTRHSHRRSLVHNADNHLTVGETQLPTLSCLLRMERSALRSHSSRTISTWPRMLAQCSGVLSPCRHNPQHHVLIPTATLLHLGRAMQCRALESNGEGTALDAARNGSLGALMTPHQIQAVDVGALVQQVPHRRDVAVVGGTAERRLRHLPTPP
jgi:hypothetical protein